MLQQFWGELTAPFVGQNWWSVLNSGIVTTGLSAVVGIYLAQRVNKVAETTQAQTDAASATDAEKAELREERAAPPPGPDDARIKTSFEAASPYVVALKSFVEAKTQRVRDGRTKRKYENIPRNDYRIIVGAIEKDGGWTPEELTELNSIFDQWRSYSRGLVLVPDFFLEKLKALARRYKVTADKPAHWSPIRRKPAD